MILCYAEVNNTSAAEAEKLGYLEEMSSEVKQLSKLRSVIDSRHEKRKEVEPPLTKIPRPPLPLPNRLKNKEDKRKFSKFMAMLKQ